MIFFLCFFFTVNGQVNSTGTKWANADLEAADESSDLMIYKSVVQSMEEWKHRKNTSKRWDYNNLEVLKFLPGIVTYLYALGRSIFRIFYVHRTLLNSHKISLILLTENVKLPTYITCIVYIFIYDGIARELKCYMKKIGDNFK